jgi:hypothetical protein
LCTTNDIQINPAYDTIHRIGAANDRYADLHEFRLTPQGTALIVIFEPISFDVRPAGRVYDDVWNQYMWDCLIQEVDIKTKDAIFEWRASDHINIKDSYNNIVDRSVGTAQSPYDPFHFNSVDKDELGNYLISARYTHAIYYISGSTNKVIWTLGGKNNTFMDVSPISPLNFAWQHDARFVDVNAFPESYVPPPAKEGSTTRLLSLFDNAAEDWNYDQGPPNARGLLLEITYPTTPAPESHTRKPARETEEINQMFKESQKSTTMSGIDAYKVADINGTNPAYTVRLVQQYSNTQTGRSSSQGSMQLVPTETGKDPHVLRHRRVQRQWHSSLRHALCRTEQLGERRRAELSRPEVLGLGWQTTRATRHCCGGWLCLCQLERSDWSQRMAPANLGWPRRRSLGCCGSDEEGRFRDQA